MNQQLLNIICIEKILLFSLPEENDVGREMVAVTAYIAIEIICPLGVTFVAAGLLFHPGFMENARVGVEPP